EASKQLGHVPIIDRNSRGRDVVPMAPHETVRYKERSGAERANSRLKDDFGANNIRVRGHSKVTLHLMLGVVTLFADQLMKILG
ncbi:MAG: transposase, partial [Pseudomonadota bacterium]|nr:transposase [Pseudomonadota bacterium]